MYTILFISGTISGANLIAIARFVHGPIGITVTWPGLALIASIRKFTACFFTGFIVGSLRYSLRYTSRYDAGSILAKQPIKPER